MAGQEIPLPVTVPEPLPARDTVNVRVDGALAAKLAVTARFELILSVQLPVPPQTPPDQPLKLEPGAADAVKGTIEPLV